IMGPKPKPLPRKFQPAGNTRARTTNAASIDEEDELEASSEVEVVQPTAKTPRHTVNWVKNPRFTHNLLTYLSDHPDFRMKLFSDSTAEAKKEGRKKVVGGDGKGVQCGVLAKHIFAKDPQEKLHYASDPGKLRNEYKEKLTILGATGAGLSSSDIRADSNLASLIGKLFDSFDSIWPWWDILHGFWRELPSYNPIGVQSSEPGTDHASAAEGLFDANGDGAEEDDNDDDNISEASKTRRRRLREADTPNNKRAISIDDDEDEDSELRQQQTPKVKSRKLPRLSPSPPPVPKRNPPQKQPKATGGRDRGGAKSGGSSAKTGSSAKKKPQNALDRLNDIREGEVVRLAEKRKLQHREEMERIGIKKMKYKIKLIQAENERLRLNRGRMSPSSPANIRTRVLNLGSSPSPVRPRRQTASPRRLFPSSTSPSKTRQLPPADSPLKESSSSPFSFLPHDVDTPAATDWSQLVSADVSSMDLSVLDGLDFTSMASSSTNVPNWYLPP
ncbi:hypothetical protein R3P38DRAFT_3520815, partial [Favolaschia claudopus]